MEVEGGGLGEALAPGPFGPRPPPAPPSVKKSPRKSISWTAGPPRQQSQPPRALQRGGPKVATHSGSTTTHDQEGLFQLLSVLHSPQTSFTGAAPPHRRKPHKAKSGLLEVISSTKSALHHFNPADQANPFLHHGASLSYPSDASPSPPSSPKQSRSFVTCHSGSSAVPCEKSPLSGSSAALCEKSPLSKSCSRLSRRTSRDASVEAEEGLTSGGFGMVAKGSDKEADSASNWSREAVQSSRLGSLQADRSVSKGAAKHFMLGQGGGPAGEWDEDRRADSALVDTLTGREEGRGVDLRQEYGIQISPLPHISTTALHAGEGEDRQPLTPHPPPLPPSQFSPPRHPPTPFSYPPSRPVNTLSSIVDTPNHTHDGGHGSPASHPGHNPTPASSTRHNTSSDGSRSAAAKGEGRDSGGGKAATTPLTVLSRFFNGLPSSARLVGRSMTTNAGRAGGQQQQLLQGKSSQHEESGAHGPAEVQRTHSAGAAALRGASLGPLSGVGCGGTAGRDSGQQCRAQGDDERAGEDASPQASGVSRSVQGSGLGVMAARKGGSSVSVSKSASVSEKAWRVRGVKSGVSGGAVGSSGASSGVPDESDEEGEEEVSSRGAVPKAPPRRSISCSGLPPLVPKTSGTLHMLHQSTTVTPPATPSPWADSCAPFTPPRASLPNSMVLPTTSHPRPPSCSTGQLSLPASEESSSLLGAAGSALMNEPIAAAAIAKSGLYSFSSRSVTEGQHNSAARDNEAASAAGAPQPSAKSASHATEGGTAAGASHPSAKSASHVSEGPGTWGTAQPCSNGTLLTCFASPAAAQQALLSPQAQPSAPDVHHAASVAPRSSSGAAAGLRPSSALPQQQQRQQQQHGLGSQHQGFLQPRASAPGLGQREGGNGLHASGTNPFITSSKVALGNGKRRPPLRSQSFLNAASSALLRAQLGKRDAEKAKRKELLAKEAV